jgi:hypothetical protein
MELEEERAPVVVTLIKPSAIDTPYTKHAKNFMENEPKNPAPVYAPEVVARTIIYCAQHPQRDVTVGSGGKILSAVGNMAPRLTDKVMESAMFSGQQKDEPNMAEDDSLYGPSGSDLEERGEYEGHVSRMSFYTAARLHPVLTGVALLGVALAVTAMILGSTGGLRAKNFAGLLPAGMVRKSRKYYKAAKKSYAHPLDRFVTHAERFAHGLRNDEAARRARGMRHAFEEWVDRAPFVRNVARGR